MEKGPSLPDSLPPDLPDEPPPPVPGSAPPSSSAPTPSGLSSRLGAGGQFSLKSPSSSSGGSTGSAADKYRSKARATSTRNAPTTTGLSRVSSTTSTSTADSSRRVSLIVRSPTQESLSCDGGKAAGNTASGSAATAAGGTTTGSKIGPLRKLTVPDLSAEADKIQPPSPSTSPLLLRKPTSTLSTSPSLARSSRMQAGTNRRSIIRPPSDPTPEKRDRSPTKAADATGGKSPAAAEDDMAAAASYNTSLTSVRDSITRQRAGSVHGAAGPLTATARLRAARRASQMKRRPSEDAESGEKAAALLPTTTVMDSPDAAAAAQASTAVPRKERPGSAGRLLDEARPRAGSGAGALEDARQRIRGRLSRSPSTELLDNDSGAESKTEANPARSISPSIVATTKSSALINLARGTTVTRSPKAAVNTTPSMLDTLQPRPLRKTPLSGSQTQLKDSGLSAIASASLDGSGGGRSTSAWSSGGAGRQTKVINVEKPPPLDDSPRKPLTLGERRQRIADAKNKRDSNLSPTDGKSKRDSHISTGSLGVVSPLSSISRISDLSVSALMDEIDRDDDEDGDQPPSISGSPPPIPAEAPPPVPNSEPSTPVADGSPMTNVPKMLPPAPLSPSKIPDESPPPLPSSAVTDVPTASKNDESPAVVTTPEPSIVGKLSPKTSLFGAKRSPSTGTKQAISASLLATRRKNNGSLFGNSPVTVPKLPSEEPPAVPLSSAPATSHNLEQGEPKAVDLSSKTSVPDDKTGTSKYSRFKSTTRSPQHPPEVPASPPNTNTAVKIVDESKDSSIRKTTVVKKKRYVASKREGGSRPLHETDLRQSQGSLRSADSMDSLDWDRKSGRSMSMSSKVSETASADVHVPSPSVSPLIIRDRAPAPAMTSSNDVVARQASQRSTNSRSSITAAVAEPPTDEGAVRPTRNDATRKSYTRAEREEARERFVQVHRRSSTSSTSGPAATATAQGDDSSTIASSARSSMRPLSSTLSGGGGSGGDTDMLSSLLGDLDADTKRLLSPDSEMTSTPPSTLQRHDVKRMSTSSRDYDSSSPGLISMGSQRRSQRRISMTPTHSKVTQSRAEVVSVPAHITAAKKVNLEHPPDKMPEKTQQLEKKPGKIVDSFARVELPDTGPPLPPSDPPPEPPPEIPDQEPPLAADPPRKKSSTKKPLVHAATLDSGALGQLIEMQKTSREERPAKTVPEEEASHEERSAKSIRNEIRRSTISTSKLKAASANSDRKSAMYSWTNDDVGDWLASQGFGDLVPLFQDQAVTGEKLAGITANQLETMGLENRDLQLQLLTQRNTLLEPTDLDFSNLGAVAGMEEDISQAEEKRAREHRKWRSSSVSAASDSSRRAHRNLSDAHWMDQDNEISAQLAQLRERQKLTDRLLGSREDLFGGMQRTDSVSGGTMTKQETELSLGSNVSALITSPMSDNAFEPPVDNRRTSTASQLERRRSVRMRPIHTWSDNDLAIYLCDHGISLSVTDKLRSAGVNGQEIINMTGDDLAEIGIMGKPAEQLIAEVDQIRHMHRHSVRSGVSSQNSFQEEEELHKRMDESVAGAPDEPDNDDSMSALSRLSPNRLSNIPEASLKRGQHLPSALADDGPPSKSASDSESDAETIGRRLIHVKPSTASLVSGSVSPTAVPPPDMFRTLSTAGRKKGAHERQSPLSSAHLATTVTEESPALQSIHQWSHSDVISWLKHCGFHKYCHRAQELQLEGKHLAVVDLALLDQLGVETDEEREAFLAAVYTATSNTNATDSVKALLRLSEGENKEKLLAMLEVLDSQAPATAVSEITTYLSGSLQDVLWPHDGEALDGPFPQSTLSRSTTPGSGGPVSPSSQVGSGSGRPLALEIQDATLRHNAKEKYDKGFVGKGKKKGMHGHVSFTDEDLPTGKSRHREFDGQRSRSVGKGPFKSKLSRWFGEGDHHYAIKASVRTLSHSRSEEIVQGNVKVYLRNLQPDTEYKAFHISSTTTAFQLIEMVLERMSIAEDPQRYRLVETSLRPGVPDRDVASFECPLLLQSLWHNDNEFHFGLRGQPVGTIKVCMGVRGVAKSDLIVQISPYTSTHQVVKLLLRKLGMNDRDAVSYCLAENSPTKGEGLVADGEYPLLRSVACGHKSTLWLRARPSFSRTNQPHHADFKHQTDSAITSPEFENAYNRLVSQAVRQRLESERERTILEEEIKRLQTQQSVSPIAEKHLPDLDEDSLERISHITGQLQIYATRLKETTVHAERVAVVDSEKAKEVVGLKEKISSMESQQLERTTQLYKLLEQKEMLEEQLSTKENTITYLRRENEVLSVDNKAARESGVNPVNREMEDTLAELTSEKLAKEKEIAQLREELGQPRRLSVRDRRRSDASAPKVETRPVYLAQLAQQASDSQHMQLITADIDCRSSRDPGWLLSPTSSDEVTQVAIIALQSGGPAQKSGMLRVGDSIVEVNNHPITKEEDVTMALKTQRVATVVVARITDNPVEPSAATAGSSTTIDQQQVTQASQADIDTAVASACQRVRSEHAEEMDSLHALMQTLESQVHEREKECLALQGKVDALQTELEEAETSSEAVGRLELQTRDLRDQLVSSEMAREQLRTSLNTLGTPHSSTQNIPMATLEQDLASIRKKLVLSEEERSVLRSAAGEKDGRISTLSTQLAEKDKELLAVRTERDNAIRSFRDGIGAKSSGSSAGIDLSDLSSKSHSDLVAALKEKEDEATQSEAYMNKLLALVIDEAPQLLAKVGTLTQEQTKSKEAQDEWY
ncbi:uncharacterized protein LOC135828562 isoform X3 [Sycon ciliatum]|uniref:uncharacterized protein LOC135828562 isoform X3 n=1 Tax=Sycon ciliatum TaxID=27933 RepID=UPI0031F6D7CD